MSATMKISLLALASTVVAIPHYGANPHGKFHSLKATGGKPYPTDGWSGKYNSTVVPQAYATGYPGDDKTTTIEETSTSTQTVYTTVVVKASPTGVKAESVSNGQCGPATVTVTASKKVTVTVTPSGGDYTPIPASSAAPVKSKPANEYGASSKVPVAEKTSSKPAAGYPVETPKPATSTSPAAEYPAETPKVEKATSSKAEGYAVPSYAQKPAASSAAPSPSATPSSGNTYSGTKRGLAYNDAALCKSFGGSYGFGYNWGQVENNDIGAPFVPMLASPQKVASVEEWTGNVEKAVKKGSKVVMGFNECDHAEQCNMSPEDACSAWKTYMNPLKSSYPDVTIVGPSVTNGGIPMGLNWLSRFHDCCPDAVVDATNIHFYDIYEETLTLERFKAQVEKAWELYQKKVWVTEFGLNPGCTEDQSAAFLKGAIEYLDGSDKVQGYSYFMVGAAATQLNKDSPLAAIYAGSSY